MNQKPAVIVIDSDAKFRKVVAKQLSEINSAELVGEAENTAGGLELLSRTTVDIAILELPSGDAHALEAVARWLREYPGLQVHVSSSSKNSELILSAMRAGATEYLTKPLDASEFRQAIERAVGRVRAVVPREPQPSSTIALFSKKGGQGVTTLAVNLAVALSTAEETRTVLLDMALDQGDASGFLDLTPEFTFADALDKNQRIDPGRLQSCLLRHSSGVYFFGERENFDNPGSLQGDHVEQILAHLRQSFRHVVLDLPHIFDHVTQAALDGASAVLLVATPELTSVRATRYTLRALRAAGYDHNRVRIILNRVSKRNPISVGQFTETVEHPVAFEVPDDYPRVIESINTGEPFVFSDRKSDISRSIYEIAHGIGFSPDSRGGDNSGKGSILKRVFGA